MRLEQPVVAAHSSAATLRFSPIGSYAGEIPRPATKDAGSRDDVNGKTGEIVRQGEGGLLGIHGDCPGNRRSLHAPWAGFALPAAWSR